MNIILIKTNPCIHPYNIEQLIYGIVHLSSARKQKLGSKLAEHLSFIPGPGGNDGAVDGAITNATGQLIAHFQSKLSSKPIPLAEAKILHSDLIRLRPKVCVYVAGIGYENSVKRLLDSQEITHTKIHLLTLSDIFSQSAEYHEAIALLPAHQGEAIDWSTFLV